MHNNSTLNKIMIGALLILSTPNVKQIKEETKAQLIDEKTAYYMEYLKLRWSLNKAKDMIEEAKGKRGKWLVIGKPRGNEFDEYKLIRIKKNKNFRIASIEGHGISQTYKITDKQGNEWIPLMAYLRYHRRDYIYTPYHPFFSKDYIIDAGLSYIAAVQEKVKEVLIRENLYVKFKGSKTHICNLVPDEIIPIIYVIEHNDIYMIKDEDAAIDAINKVMATIALNREKAYIYSESPMHAIGISQFTHKTWKRLWYRYVKKSKNLKFIPKQFYIGARDIRSSMAMMYLFFYDMVKIYSNMGTLDRMDSDDLMYNLIISYNGGAMPSIKGIYLAGPEWYKKRRDILKNETVYYIKKAMAIHSILAGKYAVLTSNIQY